MREERKNNLINTFSKSLKISAVMLMTSNTFMPTAIALNAMNYGNENNVATIASQRSSQVTEKDAPGSYSTIKYNITDAFPKSLNPHNYGWFTGTFYLLIDGKQPAFCVEPGVDASGTVSDGSQSISGAFAQYSPSQQKTMTMYASYAMLKYQQTNNEDYLYAGQAMVWASGGLSIVQSTVPSAISEEMRELQNLVANHFTVPSFMNKMQADAPKYDLIWNESNKDYEILLTDSNGVWENKWEQEILGQTEQKVLGDYKLDGTGADDTLLITTTNGDAAEQLVSGNFSGFSGEQSYFARPGSQDFMTAGSIDEVKAFLKVQVEKKAEEKGKGHFDKVDADTDKELAGAQFGLYSDEAASNLVAKSNVTTENGDVVFTDILAGNYFVKEIKAPTGYELDAKAYPVTVVAGKDTEWFSKNDGDFEDKKIEVIEEKGKGHFDKVDADTNEELAGAQFGLYTDKAASNLVEESNVTSSNGDVKFEDVKAGDYFVKEIKAPIGYELDSKTYPVTVVAGEDTKWFTENDGDFEDKKIAPKEGTGHFNKVDADTDKELAGAQFGLYSDEAAKNLIVKSNVTTENGDVKFTTVSAGTYYIKEIKAPIGYELDKEIYQVTVEAGKDTEWFSKTDGNFEDERIQGKLDLDKIEKASTLDSKQDPLKDAEFTIYEDINENGKLDKDEKTKVVEKLITDKKGHAESKNLDYGSYVVRETKAPEGYELLNKDFAAKIDSNATVHLNNGNPIEDAHIQAKKIIDKTDEYGNAVAGAKFGVFKLNGEQVDELVTDENGHAETIMLDYGKYYLQELEAPAGYEFDPELKIEFFIGIEKGGNGGHIEVLNDLIEGYIEIEKVDADTNEDLSGAEFTIFIDKNKNEKIDAGETADKLKTSWDGKATSEALPYGTYSVVETKAPSGYKLNETIFSITIDENNKVYSQEVEDEKLPPLCPEIKVVDDKNNNGKLDKGENTTDLPDECVVLKPKTCPRIGTVEDKNNNGKLDKDENTTDLPDECVILEPKVCPEIKAVEDKNNNGKLDKGENTTSLPDECVVLKPKTCPEIGSVNDKNNNGKLDKGENTTDLPDECVTLEPKVCPEIKTVEDKNNNGKLDKGENTTNLPDECVVLTPKTCPEIGSVEDKNNNGKLDEGENTTGLPDECVVLKEIKMPETGKLF